MLPQKTYELIFVCRDGGQEEHYLYRHRKDALEHFRLFFSQDSEDMFRSITLYEIDCEKKEETEIAVLSFVEKLPDGTLIRKDWRNWEVGRKTVWETHEFDGDSRCEGILTEKYEDHAIVDADGMQLWLDDDFLHMFW